MQLERLALHSHILPALKAWEPEEDDLLCARTLADAREAEIFDCRAIPPEFIRDSGEAAFAEAEATGAIIKLPYARCYFEFDDESAVLAVEMDHYRGRILENDEPDREIESEADSVKVGTSIQVFPFIGWGREGFLDDGWENSWGEFNNGVSSVISEEEEPTFFDCIDCVTVVHEVVVMQQAKMLLGVLALLSDKLVISEHRPDPAPKLTKARERRGALPITAAMHVLQVNVPAIRRAARAVPVGSHESPCLHWRRGHWRVLHRGSEFEKKAWVKKCLVGDPDKGFAAHTYRLRHQLPMLVNDDMEPPPEPLGAA